MQMDTNKKVSWFEKIFSLEKDPRATRLAKLSEFAQGSLRRNLFGVTFKGNYEGKEFRVSFYGLENDDSCPCLSVEILKPSSFNMYAYKYHGAHFIRLLFWLQIYRKRKTGYLDIDKELCILSKHENEVKSYLSDQKKREALIELFRRRFMSFEMEEKVIKFVKFFCSVDDIEPDKILWLLKNFG